jgi:hypothetical protein
LIGDQAKLDEGLPRLVEPFTGHGQALAQGAIGVKTQALGIGHRDQKERESTGLMAELIKHVLTDQALIHPTELTGDGAEFGQRNGAFVHPGCLLGDAVNHTKYRVPIVAGGGRWRRCHLVTSGRSNER